MCKRDNSYGWLNEDDNELFNQLNYTNNNKEALNNNDGASIYSYNYLISKADPQCSKLVEKGMVVIWKTRVPPSDIKSQKEIILPKNEKCTVGNNTLSFNKIYDTKFYVIYRSNETVEFNSSEIVDIFSSDEEIINWDDTEEGNFSYDVKSLSFSNTLGEGTLCIFGKFLSLKIIYLFISILF